MDITFTQKELDDIFSEENIKKREIEDQKAEKERKERIEQDEIVRRGKDILDAIKSHKYSMISVNDIIKYITKLEERINKLERHSCPCETRYL